MIEYLPWDSEFFGFKIGRIQGAPVQGAQDSSCPRSRLQSRPLLAQAREQGFSCLYIFSDEKLQDLTLADERVEYAWKSDGSPIAPNPSIVEATANDLPKLLPIAPNAFQDSRFYRDPNFDKHKVQDLYETWLTNSFKGFADYVLTDQNRQSFVTVKANRIGLIAVSDSARGKGLGKALLREVQSRSSEVFVATQATNEGAKKLYESSGFRHVGTHYIYHEWIR